MSQVYIALGSNLDDRYRNLGEALKRMGTQVNITARSSVYETEPWGFADQPRFLNMVVGGTTALAPRELLRFSKEIEKQMGRVPGPRYGPRLIDLDLLLYDDQSTNEGELILPHPRLAERRFVLVPLAEIAPEVLHPESQRSMSELLDALPDNSSVRFYGTAPQ